MPYTNLLILLHVWIANFIVSEALSGGFRMRLLLQEEQCYENSFQKVAKSKKRIIIIIIYYRFLRFRLDEPALSIKIYMPMYFIKPYKARLAGVANVIV